MGPSGFTAWVHTAPWYEASGVLSWGWRPGFASQSKLPPSTMIPPIEVPWPPRYLVAE